MLVWIFDALLSVQLPVNVPGKVVEHIPGCWTDTTHMENLEGIPGSWFWAGPALANVVFSRVNQQMGFLSLFQSHSTFQIN